MASNPFGKLQVARDEEELEEIQNLRKQSKDTGYELFKTDDQPKKKKKIRPEEKKKVEEQSQQKEEDVEEGFSVVKKVKKTTKTLNEEVDADQEKPQHNKKQKDYKHHNRNDQANFRSNKRQFDKHSGTGRGKEISKQGAGGKYTWGNVDQMARNEVYESVDHYFNSALNPKPKPVREEVVVEQPAETVEPETAPVEDKQPETVENVNAEGQDTENKDGKGKDRRKGKGKKGKEEEVDDSEKLVIPENAITLDEYKKAKGLDNRPATQTAQRKVESNLVEKEKPKDLSIGIGVQQENKKKGQKKKKDNAEKELLVDLTVGESSNQNRDQRYQKKQDKFKFKAEEFPTLD